MFDAIIVLHVAMKNNIMFKLLYITINAKLTEI